MNSKSNKTESNRNTPSQFKKQIPELNEAFKPKENSNRELHGTQCTIQKFSDRKTRKATFNSRSNKAGSTGNVTCIPGLLYPKPLLLQVYKTPTIYKLLHHSSFFSTLPEAVSIYSPSSRPLSVSILYVYFNSTYIFFILIAVFWSSFWSDRFNFGFDRVFVSFIGLIVCFWWYFGCVSVCMIVSVCLLILMVINRSDCYRYV